MTIKIRASKRQNNTYFSKVIRTLKCFMPISKKRKGRCSDCGACCKLPQKCLFLKYDTEGKSYCSIYNIRPIVCRKYPRAENEFLTEGSCGFRFRQE